jgi:transaldolase
MPDATLLAISENEQYPGPMSIDTSAAKLILHEYEALGLEVEQIGAELQTAGVETFSKSWDELMKVLADKSGSLS